jgi:hypothetical protein
MNPFDLRYLQGTPTKMLYYDEPCSSDGRPLKLRTISQHNTRETVKMKKDAIYVLDEKQNVVSTGRTKKANSPTSWFGEVPILEFKDEAEAEARIREVGELRENYYIVKVLKVLKPLPDVVEVKDGE